MALIGTECIPWSIKVVMNSALADTKIRKWKTSKRWWHWSGGLEDKVLRWAKWEDDFQTFSREARGHYRRSEDACCGASDTHEAPGYAINSFNPVTTFWDRCRLQHTERDYSGCVTLVRFHSELMSWTWDTDSQKLSLEPSQSFIFHVSPRVDILKLLTWMKGQRTGWERRVASQYVEASMTYWGIYIYPGCDEDLF